jgi:D-alanine--poly(phosphoribitol) ligase subunit 1
MDIIEEIDRWADICPDRNAHISSDRSMTYAELRRRSDALAAWLQARLPGRDPVAILGHREPEMLVGFLGCVKAGRPYIPVDTALPQRRMEQILSAASCTLTPEQIAEIVNIPRPAPRIPLAPDDPWYIIFTSGSTGEPKGVVITRRCLETFLAWILPEQAFRPQAETFLNQAPFSFDLSVMDLYGALCTGATLFSLTRDVVANPKHLFQALGRSNATVAIATPSFARLCLGEPTYGARMLPHVRKFFFCGEALPPAVAESLLDRFPEAEVWNSYGPTEATVAMTSVRLSRELIHRYPSLPVGKLMPGVKVYLIDEFLHPLQADARGEIVIAGPNVTPGYLNDPTRDAASFISLDGLRGYRTGDFGYFRDGWLFWEGRKDGQIKLNGYRIELGDIEANLRALPGVQDAVVLPVLNNGIAQSLTACVHLSSRDDETDSRRTARLRAALLERLPPYMLPRKFVYVDQLPMTQNGKVDRRQLAGMVV